MDKKDKSWNKIANKYHKQVGETGDFYHRTYLNPVILKLLGNVKNKKILDLACGQGYFSRILGKKGANVVGVDISDKLLSIARKIEKENLLDIKYILNDSANLKDLGDNEFDCIVSNMSFHDIREIGKTIKECSRVVKSKGKLIFSMLHPFSSAGEKDKDKTGYFCKLRKYKNSFSINHFMFDNDSQIKIYHRPIESYLQKLFQNNFLLSNFYEIVADKNKDKVSNAKLVKYKKEIPPFLIVEAIKIK